MCHEYEKTETYQGFVIADLRKRFNQITMGLDHWKDAFTCFAIDAKEKDLTVAAIEYFTGDGEVEVIACSKGRYGITTCGYWIATGEGG